MKKILKFLKKSQKNDKFVLIPNSMKMMQNIVSNSMNVSYSDQTNKCSFLCGNHGNKTIHIPATICVYID